MEQRGIPASNIIENPKRRDYAVLLFSLGSGFYF
jgi:hypothetical protein